MFDGLVFLTSSSSSSSQSLISMDSFTKTVQTLFPVHLILSCSDRCSQLLQEKYSCQMRSLLSLFPEVCDITGSIRDPASAIAYPLHRININFHDLKSVCQPTPTSETLKHRLHQCVSSFSLHEALEKEDEESTPWYDHWKDLFLQQQERSDHEFVGAFFGSVFVLLSDELEDYKTVMTQLQSRINSANIKLFFSSFLRYFIILNPDSLRLYDALAAEPSFKEFVSSYGINNCFWFDIFPDDIIVTSDTSQPQTPVGSINSSNPTRLTVTCDDRVVDPLSPSEELNPSVEMNGFIHREEIVTADQKPVVSQELATRTQQCLKQMTEGTLIPWTEKQMRFLYDAISARKGYLRKGFKQFLSIPTSSGLIRGPTNYIYKLESDEMQNRKLADLSMSLGIYELALKFYISARDEFKSDGACLYYAGASEMTAVAASLISKDMKQYFEYAVAMYQDVCKLPDLACRATILATESIRHHNPNEAALFFIRMTCEDSDLRSGLLLEQAAKCFRWSEVPRKRKAAFHYVLAGHRYSKCGLKRHALCCYKKFSSRSWSAAAEHVDFTVARLSLQLASSMPDKCSDLRTEGLERLRRNSEKLLFFQELLTEVSKHVSAKQVRFLIHVPFVESFKLEAMEGTQVKKGFQTCFLKEKMTLHFQLMSPFDLKLNNLRLVTSSEDIQATRTDTTLTANSSKCIAFSLTPNSLGKFEILGLEYETGNDFRARVQFDVKLANRLRMRCIKTLPPVQTTIQIGNNTENMDAVELLSGEVTSLQVRVSMTEDTGWRPSHILLHSNIEMFTSNSPTPMSSVPLKYAITNSFFIRAPLQARSHNICFRVEYWDGTTGEQRIMSQNIEIYVRECLVIEALVADVLSLRNTLSAGPVTLNSAGEESELWPGLTAHILTGDSCVRWNTSTREGFIRLTGSSWV